MYPWKLLRILKIYTAPECIIIPSTALEVVVILPIQIIDLLSDMPQSLGAIDKPLMFFCDDIYWVCFMVSRFFLRLETNMMDNFAYICTTPGPRPFRVNPHPRLPVSAPASLGEDRGGR